MIHRGLILGKKRKKASIISIGTEIIKGKITDFNSFWISKYLSKFGIDVKFHISVSDNIQNIAEAFNTVKNCDIVITTGGLGPTEDDNTKQAMAEFLNKNLFFDTNIWRNINKRYFKGRKEIPESNKKQAMNIKGGISIKNERGTAPGLYYNNKNTHYFLLPGPPRENRPMIENFFSETLKKNELIGNKEYEKKLRIYGVGESTLADILEGLETDCEIGYYFKEKAWLELDISNKESDWEASKKKVKETEEKIMKILNKKNIFYTGDVELNEKVFSYLKNLNKSISFAETICGGKLGSKLIEIPGASKIFKGSVVAYSDRIKIDFMGVSEKLIKKHGAVSNEVAQKMAEQARKLFGSNIGVGVTGIAGPSGGSKDKPVGLVHFTISVDNKCYNFQKNFIGDRKRIVYKVINSVFVELIKVLKKTFY
ncbi:MAG: competence/damage-inducible protein A [Candidatus Mcinerneyibacterium aminivorans]|uniref:CinA-like protein n=1 Tax=Candidatus Mcinerneyibacterium aminivorans TaxID=2703815 RepID=A0A5D0MFF9_9BACT|nr:MAG: competence/damage-inducible protein A [Candidatus Mcinerneyibacterium aminivorans]